MSEQENTLHAERRETWEGQGTRLEIVATCMSRDQWSLAVVNERGVMSMWYEFFPTAEAAIEVARKAIDEEGVEEFTSIEGYEYLDEEPFAR